MTAPREPNRRAASALATELARSGVTDACVSPGSRSTPIVLAFEREPRIRTWVVTDERASGYFALGMARETGRPVALLCTSGTAAASYAPAVAEASLSHVPLVVLTADRPPELRDWAAAQTIDQVRLFGSHARWSVDVPVPEAGVDRDGYYRTLACRAVATALDVPPGPVHLNLPFREPLLDVDEESSFREPAEPKSAPLVTVHPANGAPTPAAADAVAGKIRGRARGVIVAGPGTAAAGAVARLAAALGWPVLADPLSGLRFGDHDRSLVIDAYDVLLRHAGFAGGNRPEVVLRLGRPPVSKPLLGYLGASGSKQILVAPPGTWPDPLHSVTDVVRADPGLLCNAIVERLAGHESDPSWAERWRSANATVRAAIDDRLADDDARLEGKVFPVLRSLLPAGAALHLGNSMPVRDADSFLAGARTDLRIDGNRGASGIDGVTSAALGAAAKRTGATVLVTGDLGFLHDLGALQIAARYRSIRLVVVVVHNDGGGVFSFLPQAALGERFERLFATPHGLDLERVVTWCGGRHALPDSWHELASAVEAALDRKGLTVVEWRTSREANRVLREEVFADALSRLDPDPEGSR